jgi:hypothetical protein
MAASLRHSPKRGIGPNASFLITSSPNIRRDNKVRRGFAKSCERREQRGMARGVGRVNLRKTVNHSVVQSEQRAERCD